MPIFQYLDMWCFAQSKYFTRMNRRGTARCANGLVWTIDDLWMLLFGLRSLIPGARSINCLPLCAQTDILQPAGVVEYDNQGKL